MPPPLKRGLDAIEKGEAIGPKTQRERDWLAALKEFYKDYDKVDQEHAHAELREGMERLAAKYPDTSRRNLPRLALTRRSTTSLWNRS